MVVLVQCSYGEWLDATSHCQPCPLGSTLIRAISALTVYLSATGAYCDGVSRPRAEQNYYLVEQSDGSLVSYLLLPV